MSSWLVDATWLLLSGKMVRRHATAARRPFDVVGLSALLVPLLSCSGAVGSLPGRIWGCWPVGS